LLAGSLTRRIDAPNTLLLGGGRCMQEYSFSVTNFLPCVNSFCQFTLALGYSIRQNRINFILD
jgi:hypothetical protein